MWRPIPHRENDEPEVMGLSESIFLFVFLVLVIVAALVGLF